MYVFVGLELGQRVIILTILGSGAVAQGIFLEKSRLSLCAPTKRRSKPDILIGDDLTRL